MKNITFYLNLNDPKTNLIQYDPIEAYKVCTNLIKSQFSGGNINQKDMTIKKDDWTAKIIKALEIQVSTDKPYDIFLAILKTIYAQDEILIKIEKNSSELV